MKTMLPLLAASTAVGMLANKALSEEITLKTYNIMSDKVTRNVKILHISDLHSSSYGKKQKDLISRIKLLCPDAVMLTGDILDNRCPNFDGMYLLKYLSRNFPCYYVSGNHELYTGYLDMIKDTLKDMGITVLEGNTKDVVLNGQKISVSGIDDPYVFPDKNGNYWEDQLEKCEKECDKSCFGILLTHRPELVSYYFDTSYDLILSGHAHGGQVILPYIANGIYAPHQGFLPKYAGGRYFLKKGQSMIVSRGLSKFVRPRVFNRPELVLVNILPR